MNDVAADVISIIRKKIPANKPVPDLTDRLMDLGFNSLSVVELIFDLEEKFDIQIPFNANDAQPELETVGEVVDAIKSLVDKKS